MIKTLFRRSFVAVFLPVLLAGCGSSQPSTAGNDAQDPVVPITCIGIMPAVPVSDVSGTAAGEQKKSLQQGVDVMNRFLARELSGADKIVFIGADQMAGLQLSGGENSVEVARLAGKYIHCSAMLETTVVRYTERVGTKWAVERPAAVAFDLRLIDTQTENLLWTAKFDEEQIPVLDNLYDWTKARTRGFTWIKADELMVEGMREKISTCPYFRRLLGGNVQGSGDDSFEDNI